MSKPDDVPQDVWDAARDPSLDAFITPDTETAQVIIARAIMDAEKRGEERERRACAMVARGMHVAHSPNECDIYSDDVAAAIRARSA